MASFEYDEDETPLDDDEYEYAGNEEYEDMNQVPEQFSDEDESVDEEQLIVNKNNNSAGQNKSQASYTDEMNLIDYVIEEEKEIGGNKGEDSLSLSRSTTYSK